MNSLSVSLGVQIRNRRKELGMTLKQLGEAIDYKPQNVWNIEQGTPMSDGLKLRIAKALNCEIGTELRPIKKKKRGNNDK